MYLYDIYTADIKEKRVCKKANFLTSQNGLTFAIFNLDML